MELLPVPTLETERLRLRPFRESDIDDYAVLNADPEVMFYLGGPWDRGRSWRHLAFQIGHWLLGRPGMWAVEQRETGLFVGIAGFSEPEGWPGFELAGRLARCWWGQGYAAEAGRASLRHAFTVWNKDRVISLVHPENRVSRRLVEHLGGKLQGRVLLAGEEKLCFEYDAPRGLPESRLEDLVDCTGYRGPARTLEEMEGGIAEGGRSR